MQMNKPDRRIEKTKQAVFHALADLLQEKMYASLTIQEIIDRANIGRTTFYAHFPAKDDLLVAYMETIFESLHQRLPVGCSRTMPRRGAFLSQHYSNTCKTTGGRSWVW